MGPDLARSILREHADSQWDATIVAVVVGITRDHQDDLPALDQVGQQSLACGCSDALPEDIRALL